MVLEGETPRGILPFYCSSARAFSNRLITSIPPPSHPPQRLNGFKASSFHIVRYCLHQKSGRKMHRLARIKNALHLSKNSRNDKMLDSPPSPKPVLQNIWNFNFNSNGVAGGYTCPSPTTCGLCHYFLSHSFIYQLFTKKFFDVGQTTDLFAWSRASECALCMYLCVKLVDATDGQIPLDARVVVRWNTTDTAVKGGRRDEVGSWSFELMSVNMSSEPGVFKAWTEALHCWSEEGMWSFSFSTRQFME